MSADSLQLSLYTLRYDEQCSIAGSSEMAALLLQDKKRSDGHALDLITTILHDKLVLKESNAL